MIEIDPSGEVGAIEAHLEFITYPRIIILPLRKLMMFGHALTLLYTILLKLYEAD